ncbi:MAG: TIGR01777 family oxidoreductase [Candidatus Eremiobacteraeota bacterium]|nr:TIGR01777 family oxidoreductase [Candidatus Eremiobacteraeota bacterium]MCW5867220.1 TIGR01777 family oxidoreductase [Candidatus Eremiobacteraeota bacterium]
MRFRARSRQPGTAQQLYDWHLRPGALSLLTPPWEFLRARGRDQGLRDGDLRHLQVTPLYLSWWARHGHFQPGRGFEDFQERGPLRRWLHQHSFLTADRQGSWLVDEVDFELPLAPASRLVGPWLRRQLERMFRFRHLATRLWRSIPQPSRPGRYAVSGASGVLGQALVAVLSTAGHEVIRLVRRTVAAPDEVSWEPHGDRLAERLEGLDGFIHLAGKGILDGNYGPAHRAEIDSSRGLATASLCRSLAALRRPPAVFVSASGIGYYGHRPEGFCSEGVGPGQDFLAQVCVRWEAASQPIEAVGTRRVCLRIAPVLTLRGGALPPLYWSCLAGPSWRLGDGKQPFNWISLEDTLGMVLAALAQQQWRGPVNCCAPQPTTLGECAREVGLVLGGRPQLSLPEAWARLALGRRAPLLLEGCFGVPERALELGYRFLYPDLAGCLRHALGCYRGEHAPDWSFEWFPN